MRTSICGERALVIGATGGLGSVMAKRLVSLGTNVVLVGRNGKKLNQLKLDCLALGSVRVETILCDITVEDSIKSMIRVLEDTGGIDILVNAADRKSVV